MSSNHVQSDQLEFNNFTLLYSTDKKHIL